MVKIKNNEMNVKFINKLPTRALIGKRATNKKINLSEVLELEINLLIFSIIFWLRGTDLNRRPSGYEPDELPDCSTPRYI